MFIKKIHINIQNDQFTIAEKEQKPLKRGSALRTLSQIEEILHKQLKCSQNAFSHLSQEDLWKQLEQKAAGIQEGYLRKTSSLSFFRRFFGRIDRKEKEIETIYLRIKQLASAKIFALADDMTHEICCFLQVKDLVKLSQVNHRFHHQVNQAFIQRAREYGYKGVDLKGAIAFLRILFKSINTLIHKGFFPKKYIPQSSSRLKSMDAEETFKNITDINCLFKNGYSLLHLAVLIGKNDFVKLTLSLGADINVKAHYTEETPLHIASRRRDKKSRNIAETLVERGADVNAVEKKHGGTPLSNAVVNSSSEFVLFLLKNGASVNHRTNRGYSPLHLAACNSRVRIIKLLLDHGADKNLRTKRGEKAFDLNGSNIASIFDMQKAAALL